jgi:hypothetical protein
MKKGKERKGEENEKKRDKKWRDYKANKMGSDPSSLNP